MGLFDAWAGSSSRHAFASPEASVKTHKASIREAALRIALGPEESFMTMRLCQLMLREGRTCELTYVNENPVEFENVGYRVRLSGPPVRALPNLVV